MRARSNRRKAQPRQIKLPHIKIRWRALAVPPLVIGLCLAGFNGAKVLFDRPVQKLTIEAPFQRVTSVQIESVVEPGLGQGFLSVDLDALSGRLLELDWVDAAKISRRWPDTLFVQVREHTAAARWGSNGLLNVRGELFTEDAHYSFPELPLLDGPSGSERRVAELYLAVRGRLAEAHLQLDTLQMDDRGSLHFNLASGQQVRIGREDVLARLNRFFDVVAPVLAADLSAVSYVDLRYANGFSIGWANPPSSGLAQVKEYPSSG